MGPHPLVKDSKYFTDVCSLIYALMYWDERSHGKHSKNICGKQRRPDRGSRQDTHIVSYEPSKNLQKSVLFLLLFRTRWLADGIGLGVRGIIIVTFTATLRNLFVHGFITCSYSAVFGKQNERTTSTSRT